MFINKASPSKIKAYDECKKKYKFKYIDYLKGIYNKNSNTDALQFGSYIHKVLELGYQTSSVEELRVIAEECRSNYKFPKSRDKGVEKILTNFLKFNSQLHEHISSELAFEVEMKDDYKLNGIIDRVVKGKTGKYLVIDYKTSKRAATSTDLYKDPQLMMYAYAVSKMYNVPLDDITVAHYYPHLDKLVSLKYGKTQIGQFLSLLNRKIWDIRKKKKTEFRASQNMFCNWCQYKDLCPEFGGTEQLLEEALKKEKEARSQSKITKG